jgi:hypothetical protein
LAPAFGLNDVLFDAYFFLLMTDWGSITDRNLAGFFHNFDHGAINRPPLLPPGGPTVQRWPLWLRHAGGRFEGRRIGKVGVGQHRKGGFGAARAQLQVAGGAVVLFWRFFEVEP